LLDDPGSSLAGVLTLANMRVKLSVDGSSCLRQLANDLTLRWKLFVAVLTNSKHRYPISLLHDSELASRHMSTAFRLSFSWADNAPTQVAGMVKIEQLLTP
jgi:hypothetical protein